MRVWILVIFLVLSLLAISPNPYARGVQITNVDLDSKAIEVGVSTGEIIQSINNQPINNLEEFNQISQALSNYPFEIQVTTSEKTYIYNISDSIGFKVDKLTITQVSNDAPVNMNEKLLAINDIRIENDTHFNEVIKDLISVYTIVIVTNKDEYAYLGPSLGIDVSEAKTSNIQKGLDLEGGTRVLLKPVSDRVIIDSDLDDLIAVLSNRLNVYGLKDLTIRKATDWEGNKFVLVEIAGVTEDEVKDLIAKQGKFEAKIGNETVFIGGKEDIPFVCRGDGSCSGIKSCNPTGQGDAWSCKFEFAIRLNPVAAKKHAEVTGKLDVIREEGYAYLSKNIDFYLDDKLVDSLRISENLKGVEATEIQISGPGYGNSKASAIDDSLNNMNKLQTVLITGSLDYGLQIEKLDTISPTLGEGFIKNSVLVGFLAILGVLLVIFIRYRNFKIISLMAVNMLSEVVIILGFSAFIGWNLDIAAIAGIIASVGTGVDDLIVIVDEVMRGETKSLNWKERLKRAFSIIFVAYATTVAAMIPLWNAGAGLIRGFAVIIIIGVSIGVFITRPAFSSMIESLLKK